MKESYVHFYARFFLLVWTPELTSAEVTMVVKQWWQVEAPQAPPEQAAEVSESRGTGKPQPRRECHFTHAVRWLQRPCLSVGISDQLVLYGLALQATNGDAMEAGSAGRVLERAKSLHWQAFRGRPKAWARARLPLELAKRDPMFAVRHPQLLPRAASTMPGVVADIVTHKLPHNLDEIVLRRQRRAFLASAAWALLPALITLRCYRRRRLLASRVFAAVTGLSAGLTGYLACLVHGVPASLQAAVLLWIQPLGAARVLITDTAEEKTLAGILKLIARVVVPRPSQPLLAGDVVLETGPRSAPK